MSQETSREKKRRSPERQTPCTACPQRVPGFPPPGPAPPPERATQKGTNPRQPHLSPARPGHPPCSILRVRGRGCASSLHRAFIWNVSRHEEFPASPGEIPELGERAQVMPTPPRVPRQPEGRLRAQFEWHPEAAAPGKKKKQAENKTKPAITPDGRGIGFWPPLRFPPPPPACCGLNAAGFVWLIGSVNQVSVRGSCPGEGS